MRIFAYIVLTGVYQAAQTGLPAFTGEQYVKEVYMESKRQQKVARQIQKDLGDIFQKEAKHLLDGAFVTITTVRVTQDLSIARAYLSVLPEEKKQLVLDNVTEYVKLIRQKLGERVRHQLRIVPNLQFYLDDTAEYAAKMDALFSGLDIPEPREDGTEGDYKS